MVLGCKLSVKLRNYDLPLTTPMVTRQIRLSTLEQMQKRLKEFIGRKINIVLSNRTVLLGELKRSDDTSLTFANMRLESFTLSLKDISEVYLDFKE